MNPVKRLAIVAVVLLALTGCVGQAVRHTEDWLADQPFVTDIQVVDSTVDDLSFRATISAELDPKATDKDIEKLIDDTLAYVASQPGDDVKVQFGMHDVDFLVADADGARKALATWHQVVDVPDLTSGLVSPDSLWVRTPLASSNAVYEALAPLPTDIEVDAVLGDGVERAAIIKSADCEPADAVLSLVGGILGDEQLSSAEFDLCTGLDATFTSAFPLADAVVAIRPEFDAQGLSDFPIRLSIRPESDVSADYHFVSVTPGDPAALAVVAGLEASGVAMRYDLDGQRALLLVSDTLLARDLLSALGGLDAAALLPSITLQGSDTTVTGTIAQLPGLLGAQN